MATDIPIEVLIAADINQPKPELDPELPLLEERLKEAAKTQTVQLKVTAQDILYLQRAAAVSGTDWKTYLQGQVRTKILNREGSIGAALIDGPSWATKRILGPSI